MDKLKTMLDDNTARLSARERYFEPSFRAARNLLDAAHAGNGGLVFPSGEVVGPQGCSCSDRGCLHAVAWRVFTGK